MSRFEPISAAIFRRVTRKAAPAPRYASTPIGRLADLAIEALYENDVVMARVCLRRIIDIDSGGKR